MSNNNRWFIDGNFSMSPSQFQQLYVIRAPLGTSAVFCVYALLSGKSQIINDTLLKVSVDPTTVVCDFEQATINAFTAVLCAAVAEGAGARSDNGIQRRRQR